MVLDPALNAYRDDVADIELAGQVVASHYAEPFLRRATGDTQLSSDAGASDEGVTLRAGEFFAVLDCARGLAWGYRQSDHRVGYVDQKMLAED